MNKWFRLNVLCQSRQGPGGKPTRSEGGWGCSLGCPPSAAQPQRFRVAPWPRPRGRRPLPAAQRLAGLRGSHGGRRAPRKLGEPTATGSGETRWRQGRGLRERDKASRAGHGRPHACPWQTRTSALATAGPPGPSPSCLPFLRPRRALGCRLHLGEGLERASPPPPPPRWFPAPGQEVKVGGLSATTPIAGYPEPAPTVSSLLLLQVRIALRLGMRERSSLGPGKDLSASRQP